MKHWIRWLKQNIERNCNKNELINILIKYTKISKKEALMYYYYSYNYFIVLYYNLNIILNNLKSSPLARCTGKDAYTNKANICIIDNFINNKICDNLINIIKKENTPSILTHYSDDINFRTNRTCFMDEKLQRYKIYY